MASFDHTGVDAVYHDPEMVLSTFVPAFVDPEEDVFAVFAGDAQVGEVVDLGSVFVAHASMVTQCNGAAQVGWAKYLQ